MYDPSILYGDPILSGYSLGYRDQTLQGLLLAPPANVGAKSARYRVFDRSHWLVYKSRREPGTVANEISGKKWSEDNYYVQEHSLQGAVADEERQTLDGAGGLADSDFGGALQIDPDKDMTGQITGSLMLEHEIKVATLYRNTSNYAATNKVTLVTADQWDNYSGATSDPIAVIRAARLAIFSLTGVWPNTLGIPVEGMMYLENHPVIVDRFKNFNLTDPEAFRMLTGFDGKIVPLVSKYNAANNVDMTESITSVWGKDVWLGIANEGLGLLDPSFAKTFQLPYPDGNVRPVDRWREEPRKSDLQRVSWNYDVQLTSAIAGFLVTNAFGASAWT